MTGDLDAERQLLREKLTRAVLVASFRAAQIAMRESNQVARTLTIAMLALMRDDQQEAFKQLQEIHDRLGLSEEYIAKMVESVEKLPDAR